MASVYVLKSTRDGKLYIGSTTDLTVRLTAHNSGKVRSTKGRRPLALIYSGKFSSVTEARRRELFLKSGQGRKILNQILERWPSG